MAKVALIKLFPGLNIGVAQLSAELQKQGHESSVFFFKERIVDVYQQPIPPQYRITELPSISDFINKKGITRKTLDYYKPISEKELELLCQQLEAFSPDLIGFSVHSGIIEESGLVTKHLKMRFDAPVIWGGAGPTLEPIRCLKYADLVCTGEGDDVINELAARLDKKQDIHGIIGVWSKKGDALVKTEKRTLPDLDTLSSPNWDPRFYTLIDNDTLTTPYNPLQDNEYNILTQRGCPFSCSFCIESKHQEMFGKKEHLRRRDPDLVIEELKYAKQHYKLDTVWFVDDVFTINPRWLKDFLPKYKKEINIPFWCFTYPTTHNPEILKLLKDNGCTSITMGVQSGSQRLLNGILHRPTKLDRVIEAGKEIVDSGLVGQFDLIVRIHTETLEDLEETFQLLLKLPKELVAFSFAEMVVYPTYQYKDTLGKIISTDEDYHNAYVGGSKSVSDHDYQYYIKLFRLARTRMPVEQIRQIAKDPKYRRDHNLLNPYLGWDNWVEEVLEWRKLIPADKKRFHYSEGSSHPEKSFPVRGGKAPRHTAP